VADSKISALAAVASLADTDELILASAGTTKKITGVNLKGATRPGYGTTLPASPADGQEYILVDNVTAPSYMWRLRYNAGSSSAYKWEFVGGSPARASVIADEVTTTAGSWVNLATDGPSVLIPRTGSYDLDYGSSAYHSVLEADSLCAVAVGNGSPITANVEFTWGGATSQHGLVSSRSERVSSFAASDIAKLRYFTYMAGTAHWRARFLSVLPVRVS
jgi:hypothetical protein